MIGGEVRESVGGVRLASFPSVDEVQPQGVAEQDKFGIRHES